MPYRQKGSPYWYVSLTSRSGRRVKKSSGTTDRREAVALEAKWREEQRQQDVWGAPERLSIAEMLNRFLTAHATKRSARSDRIRAVTLLQHLGDGDAYQLDRPAIKAYIAARQGQGRKASTVNRELALLSAAINEAIEDGYPVPPVVKGRKLREPEGKTRWLTRAEVARLIEAARRTDQPALSDWILVAVHTGLRAGEMAALQWQHVQGGRLTVPAETAKSGRSRVLPLTPDALAAIARQTKRSMFVWSHDDGQPLKDVRGSLERACQIAGIERITPHVLRHTCASWQVQAGVPLYTVQKWLGHSTLKMTERYAHLAPEHLREGAVALAGVVDSNNLEMIYEKI